MYTNQLKFVCISFLFLCKNTDMYLTIVLVVVVVVVVVVVISIVVVLEDISILLSGFDNLL